MSYVCITSFILLTVFIYFNEKENLSPNGIKNSILPAISHFVTLYTFYAASALGVVAYVSSIRRLSGLFSVIAGKFLFQEEITKRTWMTVIGLISGAAIIILSS